MKKKIFKGVFAFLFCFLAAMVFGGHEKASAVEKDVYQNAKKTKVMIELESNPSTGYEWKYTMDKKGIVTCVRDLYEPEEDTSEYPMAGAPGWAKYAFKAKKAGTVTITFRYARQWEKTESDIVLRYKIVTGKNGKIKSVKQIKKQGKNFAS